MRFRVRSHLRFLGLDYAVVFTDFLDQLSGGLSASNLPANNCSNPSAARLIWRLTVVESLLGLTHVGVLITLLIERFSLK